jgi:hypothetical protein
MKSDCMNKELGKFFGTVLRLPWMSQPVKTTFKASRRDILLLCHLIDRSLAADEVKGYLPPESVEGIRAIAAGLLEKAELPEEFSQGFKELSNSRIVG